MLHLDMMTIVFTSLNLDEILKCEHILVRLHFNSPLRIVAVFLFHFMTGNSIQAHVFFYRYVLLQDKTRIIFQLIRLYSFLSVMKADGLECGRQSHWGHYRGSSGRCSR